MPCLFKNPKDFGSSVRCAQLFMWDIETSRYSAWLFDAGVLCHAWMNLGCASALGSPKSASPPPARHVLHNHHSRYTLVLVQNAGAMHACGHDAHMAMVLGAARVLKENEGSLNGTVKLIFQPGEEGFAGAKYMVEQGKMLIWLFCEALFCRWERSATEPPCVLFFEPG